jgi:HSP20 family protein
MTSLSLRPFTPNFARDLFDRQIDRLFEEAFRAFNGKASYWSPQCNVWENGDHYCIEAVLPGWERKDIEITAEDGVVTLKGERKEESSDPGQTFSLCEWSSGPFSRTFSLPAYVDFEKAKASFKEGVLTIMFPKHENAKPRHIMIQAR